MTLCHADLASSAPAQVLAFARSLPALRRLRCTGLAADLNGAELLTLAALTRLHELDLEGLQARRKADADFRALAALVGLHTLRLASCGAGNGTARIVADLPAHPWSAAASPGAGC